MAVAIIPMLWLTSLVALPVLGYSFLHLLWLLPVGCVLGVLSPFFPLSVLRYPGQVYGWLCCVGLPLLQEPTEEEVAELVDAINALLNKRGGPRLQRVGDAHRGWKAATDKKTRTKTWMRVLGKEDVDHLRNLLTAKGAKWRNWGYRLHSGNIIIYAPAPPLDAEASEHEHPKLRMVKHLRVVPEAGGPFRLQHLRHKRRWCPIDGGVGDLETIADFIANDRLGPCNPQDAVDAEQLRLRYHPPAAG